MAVQRKQMFRFRVSVNPYRGDATTKWSTIAESFMLVHEESSIEGCRERTSLLLAYYKANDKEKLYKSGTDEEYSLKEQLLQEVLELSNEASDKKNDKQKEDLEKAQTIRKKALECLKPATGAATTCQSDETPTKRRRSSGSVLQYLEEKGALTKEIEREKLNLEKQRLELDKTKQEMDLERFRLEKEERSLMMKLIAKLAEKKD